MKREFRSTCRGEIRVAEDTPGRFAVIAVRYGVLDDYGTMFRPGCFTDSLARKLPVLCNNHDWSDVLGRAVSYQDTAQDLRLVFDFTDLSIEACQRAYLELKKGVIDEFSVGFERIAQSDDDSGTGTWIEKAELYECSKVLAGAVPGTALLAIRSKADSLVSPILRLDVRASKTVGIDEVSQILTRMSLGELDLHDALGQVKALAVDEPAGDDGEATTDDGDAEPPSGEVADADVDAPAGDDQDDDDDDQGSGDGTEDLLASLDHALSLVDLLG